MSRKGTPLRSIVDLTMGVCAVTISFFSGLIDDTVDETKKIVQESVEKTSEIVSNSIQSTSEMLMKITQYTGLYSAYSFLVKIVELIAKVPEFIVTVIKNAIVFFYIFCVLVFVGQFNWLLDDIYTLTAISLLLTYLTYR